MVTTADALAAGRAHEMIASAPAGHHAAAADLVHRVFAVGLDRLFLFSALATAVGAVGAAVVLLLVRPTREAAKPDSTPDTRTKVAA